MASAKQAGRVLLPDTVIPVRYDIRLEPDLNNFTFQGTQETSVEVKEATDVITVHIKELRIDHASVVFKPEEGGEEVKPEEVIYNLKDATVTFKFDQMLVVGMGVLSLSFVGCLNNEMAGFYRSSYKDIAGTKKVMASTQFESLDARRCFPCWDEPARKAIFAVTLVVDSGLTAFSNMPEKTSKFLEGGVKREVQFMDTPKMSTYLLAFVIGEFDSVQAKTNHGVLVKVYTPPGRAKDGEFALDCAVKSLDGYDDYFGIPYPLPKLDMVAIPEFAAGAMENWGLVTYREVDLLVAPGASRNQLQRITIVVTHELAHQWFGNLVTMMWWDDLWLNEGFASWCENYMADVIFPDYAIWDQFVSDTQAAALRLDGLRTSHPIQVPIARAEEVEEVFDAISYCKGASVIKMAHAFLGADAFQKGLRDYFKKHAYGNTETLDLWGAWDAASGKPVSALMAAWTEQMGFPLVTVTEDGGSVLLTQNWFLADGSEVKPDEEKLWKIPLLVATEAGASPLELMENRTHTLSKPPGFLLLNVGRHVPMRVRYTDAMYGQLAVAIEKGLLSSTDRAGLVLDAFALAKAGKLESDAVFKLLSSFKNENDYTVWEAISQALNGFNNILMAGASDAIYEKFVNFVAKLISKAFARVGWEKKDTDGHLDGLLRETLLVLQSKYSKEDSLVAEARRRFNAFMAGNKGALPDDIKVPAFQIVLKMGGVTEYQQLRDYCDTAETNVEKKHVYSSIGHTADIAKKKEVLEWVASGSILLQDFFYPLGSVSTSSKAAGAMTWEFYKENFDKFKAMLKSANPQLMDPLIQYSARGFCTTEAADEVEAFFKKNNLPSNQRTISQLLESLRTNATFLDRIIKTPVNQEAFWDSL